MSSTATTADDAPTVTVTTAAASEALRLIEGEGLDTDEAGLRLFVQQGGCAGLSYGMRFDTAPEDDDAVVEENGLRVFVDPASRNYVGDLSSPSRTDCRVQGSTSRTRTSSPSAVVASRSGHDIAGRAA